MAAVCYAPDLAEAATCLETSHSWLVHSPAEIVHTESTGSESRSTLQADMPRRTIDQHRQMLLHLCEGGLAPPLNLAVLQGYVLAHPTLIQSEFTSHHLSFHNEAEHVPRNPVRAVTSDTSEETGVQAET